MRHGGRSVIDRRRNPDHDECQSKDQTRRCFQVDDFLQIMDDERFRVNPGTTPASKPDLEIRQRADPGEDLKQNAIPKRGEMQPFDPPRPPADEKAARQKKNPDKMNHHHRIRGKAADLANHILISQEPKTLDNAIKFTD